MGREWLSTLRYKVPQQMKVRQKIIQKDVEISVETKQLSSELPTVLKQRNIKKTVDQIETKCTYYATE